MGCLRRIGVGLLVLGACADDSDGTDDAADTGGTMSSADDDDDDASTTGDDDDDASTTGDDDDDAMTSSSSGGAASTGSASADSTGGGSTGGETVSVDCASYCALMDEYCATDMIHPVESCEYLCEHPQVAFFDDAGSLDDEDGNTLGCRIHHALVAAVSAGDTRAEACAAANLSGGDVCGSFCDNYCLASMEACSDGNPEYSLPTPNFPGFAACQMACGEMGTEVLTGIAQPEQLFGYGDTVQCRLHHLHAATEMDMYDLHCPHASEDSTGDTCSDAAQPNLANYCAFATGHCTGDNALFEPGASVGECMATVEPLVTGGTYTQGAFASFTDDSGATVGCLNHWIVQTPWDPDTLCAMADWDPDQWESNGGAGVCDGD